LIELYKVEFCWGLEKLLGGNTIDGFPKDQRLPNHNRHLSNWDRIFKSSFEDKEVLLARFKILKSVRNPVAD